MHSDSSKHALALEYLFLFHACKLTNHRPDQSVSQADVARAAGLNEDQSEAICTPLREARLIRFSSLLGDISATRFGVSEIITSKACPNSGSNYFPAISQMGLRYSRGHHLFDESELTWASRYQDIEASDWGSDTEAPEETESSVPADTSLSTQDTRRALISELEKLLQELSETPTAPSVQRPHRQDQQSSKPAYHIETETHNQSAADPLNNNGNDRFFGTPSLLLNANWSVSRQENMGESEGHGTSIAQTNNETKPVFRAPAKAQNSFTTNAKVVGPAGSSTNLANRDALGQLELLFRFLQSSWSKPAGEQLIRRCARGMIEELESVNDSLLHFA